MSRAFRSIPIDARLSKPRNAQLTMVADFGLPLAATEDLLGLSSEWLDLAKVAVGTSALYREDDLRRKIALYRDRDVLAFPGGQFLEYAIHRGLVDAYFQDAKHVGFSVIEVSNNLLPLSIEDKRDIIARATGEHGLRVLGEVGSKDVATNAADMLADARACLDAGAWKVLVEAAEFFDGGAFNEQLASTFQRELPTDDIIFELPGAWIEGIGPSEIHAMQVWLLENIGAHVNVGNVAPADLLAFEALRRNLGVHMRFDAPL